MALQRAHRRPCDGRTPHHVVRARTSIIRAAKSKDQTVPEAGLLNTRRLKLIVAYDGSNFAGFQWQKGNVRTVQGELEKAATRLFHADSRVVGASRTDSGAHAKGQVAHLDVFGERDLESDLVQYNDLLPGDVKVIGAQAALEGFDAHFSSNGKEYHYLLSHGPPDPFQAKYRWWVCDRWCEAHRGKPKRLQEIALDVPRMQEAAQHLLGTHDFSAFADNKRAPGMGALKRKKPKLAELAQQGIKVERSSDKNTRTIWKLEVLEEGQEAGQVCIKIAGDGFLYRMVRMVAAALVEVGHGRLSPDQLAHILQSGDRGKLPGAAPAHGLYLMRVFYDDNPYLNEGASE